MKKFNKKFFIKFELDTSPAFSYLWGAQVLGIDSLWV